MTTDGSLILEDVVRQFSKLPRLLFVTMKSMDDNPRRQKLGFCNDMIRKLADSYFIVREQNKQKEGFHFHAIVSVKRDIKPNWYRKGLYVHLQVIGGPCPQYDPPTQEEDEHKVDEYLHEVGADTPELVELHLAARDHRIAEARRSKGVEMRDKKARHVSRVVGYMTKELVTPVEYGNYILRM